MEGNDLTGDILVPNTEKVSFKNRIMSLQLSNIKYREWLQHQRESVQPWTEFFNMGKFKAPQNVAKVGVRVVSNIEKFQSNYMFVFLVLVAFCILTSPLLLIAIAASFGACYIISLKNKDAPIKFMGKDVALAHQYAGVGLISFPVFWLAGAGSAMFWLLGASVFVIMLHATMYEPVSGQFEELDEIKMEPV